MMAARFSFYEALVECQTVTEMKEIIEDMLAPHEIELVKGRWAIAQTLMITGCLKSEAEERHDASQDLVVRVYDSVHRKKSGYKLAYGRLVKKRQSKSKGAK